MTHHMTSVYRVDRTIYIKQCNYPNGENWFYEYRDKDKCKDGAYTVAIFTIKFKNKKEA